MKLSVQNLTKTYRNGVRAIDEISFELSPGMFGLLGPNGAGKSSLMRTIATLQLPDAGSIQFDGLDIFSHKTAFRKNLGYLPQEFGVYPKDTARELLGYFALLKGIASAKERRMMVERVLEVTNLREAGHQRVSTFSGGMKQRFGIAQLLLNQPKVIIVDEPTAGLDPAERTRFLNVLRAVGSENIVIFSTHLVEDVKALCQDMAIIDRGRLLAQTAPAAATEKLKGKIWETERTERELTGSSIPFLKLSERYDEDNRLLNRIYAETCPAGTGQPVDPKLEDFYFLTLSRGQS